VKTHNPEAAGALQAAAIFGRFCRKTLLLLAVLALAMGGCQSPQQQSTPTASLEAAPTTTQAVLPLETTPAEAPTVTPTGLPVPAATHLPGLIDPPNQFDGQRAYQDVIHQVALGPRTPGSVAHNQAILWIKSELEENGWEVEIQETTQNKQPVRNIIAKRGEGAPWHIVGAHFDSRMKADNDPDPANHDKAVPAANDGASGVAVLLELARVLPKETPGQIWLAFFDSEDQGRLPGWDWILGSRAMASALEGKPDAVIVVDMIGDADLNIYQETNSDPQITQELWDIAAELGYEKQFIPQAKHNMLDDHTPFLEKGIRAVDIIDFDYPYWHTIADTPDKVSAESLEAVGSTVLHWLLR